MLWIWPLTTIFRFEGVAINEHFLPKACFSTLRGESVRKHAALMAINGSLTEINVEKQHAKHAQANPDDMRTWKFLKPLLFDYNVKKNKRGTRKRKHHVETPDNALSM